MFLNDLESNGLLHGMHQDIQIMWFVFHICRIQQELVKRYKCGGLRIICDFEFLSPFVVVIWQK